MGSQIWPSVVGGAVSLLLALITLYSTGKWGRWRKRAEKAEEQSRVDRQTAWLVEQLQEDNTNLREQIVQLKSERDRRRRAP